MRIIGGHDYYDSGLAFGQDEAVVFLRNAQRNLSWDEVRKTLHLPRQAFSGGFHHLDESKRDRSFRRRHAHFDARGGLEDFILTGRRFVPRTAYVILCGHLHRGIHIECEASNSTESHWIWSAEGMRAFAHDHGMGVEEGRDEIATTWSHGRASGQQSHEVRMLSVGSWFEPTVLEGDVRNAILQERITVMSLDPTEPYTERPWRVDQPTLAGMDFAKAVDPYTAFQEIAMWKGGVLPADGPKIVEIIDDAVKIAKHGFHHPTSFRKQKEART